MSLWTYLNTEYGILSSGAFRLFKTLLLRDFKDSMSSDRFFGSGLRLNFVWNSINTKTGKHETITKTIFDNFKLLALLEVKDFSLVLQYHYSAYLKPLKTIFLSTNSCKNLQLFIIK